MKLCLKDDSGKVLTEVGVETIQSLGEGNTLLLQELATINPMSFADRMQMQELLTSMIGKDTIILPFDLSVLGTV